MTGQVSIEEHLDRVRRVRSVACPRCGAQKGQSCRSGDRHQETYHHAARYAAWYRKQAGRR